MAREQTADGKTKWTCDGPVGKGCDHKSDSPIFPDGRNPFGWTTVTIPDGKRPESSGLIEPTAITGWFFRVVDLCPTCSPPR